MAGKRGHSGQTCAVHECHNNWKKMKIWTESECEIHHSTHSDCPCIKPYSLHRFPGRRGQEEIKRQWVRNINRKGFEPNNHSVVCSVHFPDGKPTKEHPYPVLNMGYNPHKHLSPGRAPPKKRCQPLAKEASTETPDDNADPGEEPEVPEHEPIVPSAEGNPVPKASTCDVGVQWPDVSDHTYSRTKLTSTATQTDPAPSMSAYDMKAKDSAFFTGLSKDVFWALVHSLLAFLTQPMKFKMAPPDQILLVLMRLRLGLMFTDLGQRFAVSRSTACDIFASWVPVMARYMKLNSILWLPRDTLRRIRPLSFLENYPRATCIIDCTEIFVQRPKNLKKRAQTYSNYKSHNTYKALYCIAPNGFVMFVSKLFGGRASDVFISQTSGFTDHLLPGDEVLADRGFTIDGILPSGVKLSIPAFTKGLKQLPEDDVTDTRRLANVRIHVERAIRRLKCFKLLSNIIPGRVANVDDIVSICAGLCNLQPMLIQEDLSEEDIEEPMEIEDDDTSMEETEDERYMMDFAEDIE